jgi:hypothetical protein
VCPRTKQQRFFNAVLSSRILWYLVFFVVLCFVIFTLVLSYLVSHLASSSPFLFVSFLAITQPSAHFHHTVPTSNSGADVVWRGPKSRGSGMFPLHLAFSAASLLAVSQTSYCKKQDENLENETASTNTSSSSTTTTPTRVTFDTICYVLEEANANLDLLIPGLIQRLRVEMEQGFTLEANEDKINEAFQDMVMKVQDAVCRNEYVPLEDLQSGIIEFMSKQGDVGADELLRFQSATQRLQSLRLTVLQSLVTNRREGATREITLNDCIGILAGTMEGMNRSMEESYKEAFEKGFAGEERTMYASMRYEEKMKVVNDEVQSQFEVTGPAVQQVFVFVVVLFVLSIDILIFFICSCLIVFLFRHSTALQAIHYS